MARSQSTVIGFVMIVGIMMALLLVIQTTAVPTWNQGIEYNHNQRVQGELEELRDGVFRTAATGSAGSESISLGTEYPVRPFLFNPPNPSGQIRTTGRGNVTITNATAAGETGHYWTGDRRNFSDRAVVYRPNYNEYGAAPTTLLENSVLVNRFGDRDIPLTGTRLVEGRRINVVTMAGELSRGGRRALSLDLRATSAPQQVTTVRSTDGPLVLEAPTRLSQDVWADLLASERTTSGGHVTDVAVTPGDPGELRITLEEGSYDLRMARIGIGSDQERLEPQYITTGSRSERQVVSGTTGRIEFEVRDRYNNPISGVIVNATRTGGGRLLNTTAVTDAEGRAVFPYEAIGAGTATVTATFGSDPDGQRTANVSVESVDPVGAGGEQALTLEWIAPGGASPIDAGRDNTRQLTVATSPAVEGLDLQYLVGDSTVGSVDRSTGTTGPAGQDTVTFTGESNGVTDVYVVGGGDADVITMPVENASDSPPANRLPTADFVVDRRGNSQNAELNGSSSSDPDGQIVAWTWEWERNGETVRRTGETVRVGKNELPADVEVTLRVTDDDGATSSTTRTVS